MRYSYTLLLMLTMTLASPARAALDFYKEGAICDRKSGFCADHMGVSLGLTKVYLGDKAEQKLMATINKVGSDAFNPKSFTMTGGLTCDADKKQCWTSKLRDKPHDKGTKTLFNN
jgi:hypothetical protein